MNGSRNKGFPNKDMRSSVSTATVGRGNSASVPISGKSTPGPSGQALVDLMYQANAESMSDHAWCHAIAKRYAKAFGPRRSRLIAKASEMVSLLRRLTGNPHEGLSVSRVVNDARALLREIEGENA